MFLYPVELEPDDNGTLLVTSPSFPELVTFGETREAALSHAALAAEEAIASRMAAGEDVPRSLDDRARAMPRSHDIGAVLQIGLQCSIKLLLYWALRSEGITRAELARRLGWHREQVDRLFRIDHASRFDQVEAAFRALGRDVDLALRDAA